jgi:hypothetical protein
MTATINSRGSAFKFTLESTPIYVKLYGFITVILIGYYLVSFVSTLPPCARITFIFISFELIRV